MIFKYLKKILNYYEFLFYLLFFIIKNIVNLYFFILIYLVKNSTLNLDLIITN